MLRSVLAGIGFVLAIVVSQHALALEITEGTHENYQAYLSR
jgi:hypothetical protein